MNPSANAALDLRDIHAAASPALWPPAPGWWVVALVVVSLLLMSVVWLRRRWLLRQDRIEILAELDALTHCSENEPSADRIARLSALLRRIALRRYPREQVAPLSGSAWLQFLDDTGGLGEFTRGAGRILEDGAYRPDTADLQVDPLMQLARRWVTHNLEAGA